MNETRTLMIDVFIFSHVNFFLHSENIHTFLSLLMRVLKIVEKHISRETGKDTCAVFPTIQLHTAILACEVLGEIFFELSLEQGSICAIALRTWCFVLPFQRNPKDTAQILHTLLHSECVYDNSYSCTALYHSLFFCC